MEALGVGLITLPPLLEEYMAKKPEYKVCPRCGDKILVEIPKDVCDECDKPYEKEK